MKDVVSQFAMQLTLAEKRGSSPGSRGPVFEELASRACGPAGPSRCPRCCSPSFVRKGRDRDARGDARRRHGGAPHEAAPALVVLRRGDVLMPI